jgi:hypothetical protein
MPLAMKHFDRQGEYTSILMVLVVFAVLLGFALQSMFEVSHSREYHGQVMLVRSSNHFFVAH